jgi:hypothetical protein
MVSGCAGSEATVTGKVTIDGEPAKSGTVTFYADGTGPAATGNIESDGRYSLSTGTDKGLPAGSYIAAVAVVEVIQPADPRSEPIPKLLSPEKYQVPATSDLKVEVKPGANDVPLELKSN